MLPTLYFTEIKPKLFNELLSAFDEIDIRLIADDQHAEGLDQPAWYLIDWLTKDRAGLEICRDLRAAKMPQSVYITMVLDPFDNDDDTKRRAIKAGADGYLAGPLTIEKMLTRLADKIQKFLKILCEQTSNPHHLAQNQIPLGGLVGKKNPFFVRWCHFSHSSRLPDLELEGLAFARCQCGDGKLLGQSAAGETTERNTLTELVRAIIQPATWLQSRIGGSCKSIESCALVSTERIAWNANTGWHAHLGVTLGGISKSNYDKFIFINLI